MKNIIKLWQYIHYLAYICHVAESKVFLKIFKPIFKNKFVSKIDNKLMLKEDTYSFAKRYTTDKNGFGIMAANFYLSYFVFAILFLLYNCLVFITFRSKIIVENPTTIILILGVIICNVIYKISIKNNVYLTYFNEFDKMPRKESIKLRILGIVTVILIYILSFFSLYLHG